RISSRALSDNLRFPFSCRRICPVSRAGSVVRGDSQKTEHSMSRFFSAAFLLAAFCAVPAWAAPHIYYVTNPADSGANTLRQAIIDGNNLPSNDYPDIRIDLGENQPILLQSSLPEIRSKVFYMRGTQTTPAVINGLSQHALLDFHSTSYP